MTPRWAVYLCAVGAAAALAAGIGVRGEDKPTPPGLPGPVVSTHELMELFNEPIYHTLREQLKQKPAGEDGWEKVGGEARKAAEVANLIAIRKEAAEHKGWKEQAGRVQESARALAAAVGKKDYPAAREAYVGLIQNCNACHKATEPEHAPTLEPFGKGK